MFLCAHAYESTRVHDTCTRFELSRMLIEEDISESENVIIARIFKRVVKLTILLINFLFLIF